ncbi:hypothetical protein F2P81_004004 [Scophthalmus maximus]|uniref:Uncharacterized protein n=1 Tax=Scophthalmus maximus TaxID=52904 RepID=A0A6A4TB75_SCOMX|nr:hypothetical protein F2P81_004004 [Scophthalmus maximus]
MQTGEQSVSCLVQKLVLGKHERTAQKRETAGVGEEQNLSGPRRRDENTTFYSERLHHFPRVNVALQSNDRTRNSATRQLKTLPQAHLNSRNDLEESPLSVFNITHMERPM